MSCSLLDAHERLIAGAARQKGNQEGENNGEEGLHGKQFSLRVEHEVKKERQQTLKKKVSNTRRAAFFEVKAAIGVLEKQSFKGHKKAKIA